MQCPRYDGEGQDFDLKEKIGGIVKILRMESCTTREPPAEDGGDVDGIDPFSGRKAGSSGWTSSLGPNSLIRVKMVCASSCPEKDPAMLWQDVPVGHPPI